MQKNTEIMRFMIRKLYSGQKIKGEAGQPMTSTSGICHVTQGSTNMYKQKSKIEIGLPRKECGRPKDVIPCDIQRSQIQFVRILYH
jgi:hypothetical protein